jgi:hypothetical protein
VTLYKEWRLNSGEGFQLSMSKLLNNIDGDVRRISKGGTDIISGDDTPVLAMQAQIDDLKKQVLSNQTGTRHIVIDTTIEAIKCTERK